MNRRKILTLVPIVMMFFLLSVSPAHSAKPGKDRGFCFKVAAYSGSVSVSGSDSGGDDTTGSWKSSKWRLAVRKEGIVSSQKSKEKGSTPIWQSRVLLPNDKVITGKDGWAKIIASDGSSITIGPNTTVNVGVVQPARKPVRVWMKLFWGSLAADIRRFMGKESDFEITTPNGVIAARGTEFEVKIDKKKTVVCVYEGEVGAKSLNDNATCSVKAGQQARLWKSKKTKITRIVDTEPFKVAMRGFPRGVRHTIEFKDPIMEKMYEGMKKDYSISIDPKPTFVFFTNKFLEPSTVNKSTLSVFDGKKKPVDGLYRVEGSSITFIPSRPIFGDIRLVLRGGKNGVCSKTGVYLEKDQVFRFKGTNESFYWGKDTPFELTAARPLLIVRKIVLTNSGTSTARNVTLSVPSLGTFFPNIFTKLHKISSPVPYRIREDKNNTVVDFNIKNVRPGESLEINLSHAVLLFGAEYFSRLDVSGLEQYENPEIVKTFTKPEEGIESDDPRIVNLAKDIIGDEKNPFWKAYKIYDWITKTIRYNYDEVPSGGAIATLESGVGICGDFAELYIALARAAGVPSRYVALYVPLEKVEGHASVEIYVPKYGWIPVDPTWGLEADSFGSQAPFLILWAKQDGVTEKHKWEYLLGSSNRSNLKASTSVNVSVLDLKTEEDWQKVFGERFFGDIYQMVAVSQIEKEFNSLGVLNEQLDKSIFVPPEATQTDPFVLIESAVEAYRNKEYEAVQNEIQRSLTENLKATLKPFLFLAKKSKKYLEGNSYYSKADIATVSDASNQLDRVDSLLKRGESFYAANTLIEAYYSSAGMLSFLIADFTRETVLTDWRNIRLNYASIFVALLFLIGFVLLPLFWIWMMINCLLKKDFRHLNKVFWFVTIFLIYGLGAILYFIFEYRKKKLPKAAGPAPVEPSPLGMKT